MLDLAIFPPICPTLARTTWWQESPVYVRYQFVLTWWTISIGSKPLELVPCWVRSVWRHYWNWLTWVFLLLSDTELPIHRNVPLCVDSREGRTNYLYTWNHIDCGASSRDGTSDLGMHSEGATSKPRDFYISQVFRLSWETEFIQHGLILFVVDKWIRLRHVILLSLSIELNLTSVGLSVAKIWRFGRLNTWLCICTNWFFGVQIIWEACVTF